MEVVASLSQGRTAAAQCGLFTHKSVPVIFEPPCISNEKDITKQAVSSLHHICHSVCEKLQQTEFSEQKILLLQYLLYNR